MPDGWREEGLGAATRGDGRSRLTPAGRSLDSLQGGWGRRDRCGSAWRLNPDAVWGLRSADNQLQAVQVNRGSQSASRGFVSATSLQDIGCRCLDGIIFSEIPSWPVTISQLHLSIDHTTLPPTLTFIATLTARS